MVVTGCGVGLGRAIHERLAADGWAVVGIEIDPRTAAGTADWIEAAGHPGAVITGDAADRSDLERARDAAVVLAPLGGWVNNAAIVAMDSVHRPEPEAVARLIRVNLEGTYWGASTAVRTFLEQRSGGSIVSISSIHARAGFPNWASYEMSKAGIIGLTRNLAVEYGPAGIRVGLPSAAARCARLVSTLTTTSINSANAAASLACPKTSESSNLDLVSGLQRLNDGFKYRLYNYL